ncbi:MAG: secondary thiamine-phosphate synthase enzyme YjbQ [Gammaproteobacteria bacterium]|nr:secondary thiamine-phosphate synthase enzyme YjbQ [Gammaproteobacteria bacterium]
MIESLNIRTSGQGLVEITDRVRDRVASRGMRDGLCTVFLQHTSASLLIQENADPTAQRDLENWLNRLVPENDPLYSHTLEGPDDMPAHIKSMLTASSLAIPVENFTLCLGTWQGIFVFEHRRGAHTRRLKIHLS